MEFSMVLHAAELLINKLKVNYSVPTTMRVVTKDLPVPFLLTKPPKKQVTFNDFCLAFSSQHHLVTMLC